MILVPLLLALAGCASRGDGPTGPGDRDASTAAASLEATPSQDGTNGTGNPLANVDPCALLSPNAAARLALKGGTPKESAGARACRYRHQGATLDETYTVSVEFIPHGLDLYPAELKLFPITSINGHRARKFLDLGEGCGVSLEVTASYRVDNTAGGGGQDGACRFAADLAAAIEPALPS